MAIWFLDTSALVKLYVREPGTDRITRLMLEPEAHRFGVSALARLEFRSALRRRQREGHLSREAADDLIAGLGRHWGVLYTVLPLTEALLERGAGLLDRHSLKSLDTIQLSACLLWNAPARSGRASFVSSDGQLLKAAAGEGLRVWNPEKEDWK